MVVVRQIVIEGIFCRSHGLAAIPGMRKISNEFCSKPEARSIERASLFMMNSI
jgi:hypothetical protein